MGNITLAEAEYRALDRPSFSSLKHLLKSPKKYLYELSNPFLGNDATELGTAVHHYIQGNANLVVFEPDLSGIKTKDGRIASAPRMTDEGKKILKEVRASLKPEQVLVPFEAKESIKAIVNNFNENPIIKELMSKVTSFEQSYIGEIDGVPVKGRVDADGPFIIIDFKTTSTGGEPSKFKHTAIDSYYHMQAAFYRLLKGVEAECWIIALETKPPYEVYPYLVKIQTLLAGETLIHTALERYKKLKANALPLHNEVYEI